MSRVALLRIVLVLWAAWHIAFGLLSTFAPQTGGALTGWRPQAEWTADLVAMSTQYGMVMMLLGLMFLIMAFEPLRLLSLVWVAVAEQALGIAYGVYLYASFGQLTAGQLLLQAVTNAAVAGIFVVLWLGLRERARAAPA